MLWRIVQSIWTCLMFVYGYINKRFTNFFHEDFSVLLKIKISFIFRKFFALGYILFFCNSDTTEDCIYSTLYFGVKFYLKKITTILTKTRRTTAYIGYVWNVSRTAEFTELHKRVFNNYYVNTNIFFAVTENLK